MASTCTTARQEASFDDLCRGVKRSYCLNKVIWLRREDNSPMSLAEAEQRLIEHINDIILELQRQSDRRVVEYMIGKTHARQRRTQGRRYMNFDPMNPNTWRLANGANARWNSYYRTEKNYNGLVVLCAVTTDEIPQCRNNVNVQNYAFALEQRLLHHFVFVEDDDRLGNTSFSSGGHAGEEQDHVKAGLVYFAYKLSEDEDVTSKMS